MAAGDATAAGPEEAFTFAPSGTMLPAALEVRRMPELGWKRHILSVAFLVAATACGGEQPPAEAPAPAPPPSEPAAPAPTSTGEAAAPPAEPSAEPEVQIPPDTAFADLSAVQKKAFMQKVVLPHMTEVFQAFDKEHFKEVTCLTCHNKKAKEGDFHMPNPDLPKLNMANKMAEHKKKAPKMLEFMMTKVSPEMATLLKAKPYDPKTQQGFGCMNCHTMQK
jgi:hypothetical protein